MTQKITLQRTGYAPISILGRKLAECQDGLPSDKRGARVALYREEGGALWVEVQYLTTWGIERPVTHVSCFAGAGAQQIEQAAAWVREVAARILPPGAGFPALPQYETRQAKLAGQMETLVLHCLTQVLAEAVTPA